MHSVLDPIEEAAGAPFVHIADATGEAVTERGLGSVGLLATAYTMELLGCTEIDLLVGPDDAGVPLFDTTALHAARAVDLAPA
jgi:aspartate/glutamate racemase